MDKEPPKVAKVEKEKVEKNENELEETKKEKEEEEKPEKKPSEILEHKENQPPVHVDLVKTEKREVKQKSPSQSKTPETTKPLKKKETKTAVLEKRVQKPPKPKIAPLDTKSRGSDDTSDSNPQSPQPLPSPGLLNKIQTLIVSTKNTKKPPAKRVRSRVPKSLKDVGEPVNILSTDKPDAKREKSQTRLLSMKKLMLFLDVDHTLLHATRNERAKEFLTHPILKQSIHEIMFENMRGVPYFVKLRPGVNKFLTSAAEKFNIVLYTMGFKAYAKKVRELMDPTGHLIKAIISREDHNNRRGEDAKKSIQEFIPLYDSNTLIIDDFAKVWEKPENVLEVPRYAFWPDNDSDIKNYNAPGVDPWAAIELQKKDADLTLRNIDTILSTVHSVWYKPDRPSFSAPRIVDMLASGVLKGCEIVFTGIIPVQNDPRESPFWKLAKRFGCVCARNVTTSTTHVIADRRQTEKVNQAKRNPALAVVHLNWLLQSCACFVRADEKQFEFRKPPPPLQPHSTREIEMQKLRKFSGLDAFLENFENQSKKEMTEAK